MDTTIVPNDVVRKSDMPHKVKLWARGRLKAIEGAPLAQWSIVQRDQPANEIREPEWPRGRAGLARIYSGDYMVDEDNKKIVHRPSDPFSWWSVNHNFQTVRELRDAGIIRAGEGVFDIVDSVEVVRCEQRDCLYEGGWHHASRKHPHVAFELSRGIHTCRIVMLHGLWVPEIRGPGSLAPTAEMVASFKSDARWTMAELTRLAAR